MSLLDDAGLIFEGDSILSTQRKKFLLYYVIATSSITLPVSFIHFFSGDYVSASANILAITTLLILALQLVFKSETPISYLLVVLTIELAIVSAAYRYGIGAFLWSYPAVTALFFVLPKKQANYCGLFIFLLLVPVAIYGTDYAFTLRFIATSGLTMLILNVVIRIVSELQSQLVEQTIRDPLTCTFNRRHMDTCLTEVHARYQRTKEPVSILAIDIDHFKRVNDELGHSAGDTTLRNLVKVLSSNIRESDQLFRMGGEEFLLLLWGTPADKALVVAEQLRKEIAESIIIPGHPITVSIGVNSLSENDSVEHWLSGADKALYHAKSDGRNKVR